MPILLTKEEVVGKKAKVVLVHYELPFSFFFFFFLSLVLTYLSFSRTSIYLLPHHQSVQPRIGVKNPPRDSSTPPIPIPCAAALLLSFFFILQRKYTTKRGNITARVALLPPTPVWPVSQPTQGDLTMNAVIFFFFLCLNVC